jgi:chemotaxis protein methyltransferase CheR
MQRYGYDFSNYASSSFKRRVLRMLELKNITLEELLEKLSDPSFLHEFLSDLTVNVTEMFRDPALWIILRDEIIPVIISVHPQLRIWHAGCSSGEEVFSMAILLEEMGLLQHAHIVATDLDPPVLKKARSGSYPGKNMEPNEKNYRFYRGDDASLRKYYREENGLAVFDQNLVNNVSFHEHDLVTGEVFSKFDLILCRNVMIYFNQALQNDVLRKFHKSLFTSGYLSIGSKESLVWCDIANKFNMVSNTQKIYRKVKD